jgi:hypothetical protein
METYLIFLNKCLLISNYNNEKYKISRNIMLSERNKVKIDH